MDDRIWFNQTYFSYKDSSFGTSSLDIGISCSTNNFKDYSPLNLSFLINKDKKYYALQLKYQDVIDLLSSLSQIYSKIDYAFNESCEVDKKYGNKNLKIGFRISKTGERIVVLAILYGVSDFAVCVLPVQTFGVVIEILKSYKDQYMQLTFDIINRSLLTSIRDEINEVKIGIKSLPSSIVEINRDDEHQNEEMNVDSSLQDSFNSFMDENLDTIEVPDLNEIDSKPAPKIQANTAIFNTLLQNDVSRIESFLTAQTTSPNLLMSFLSNLLPYVDNSSSDIRTLLPGINDEEYKSLFYISKIIFDTYLQGYLRNGIEIPSVGIAITKYVPSPEATKSYNIELCTDLLLLTSYIKLMRDKLQQKESDSSVNKSILYLSMRCVTDSLVMTFLNPENFDSNVRYTTEKFRFFKNNNFFSSFESTLNMYGCTPITEDELQTYLNNVVRKAISGKSVIDYHKSAYANQKVKLNPDNTLKIEQINEFSQQEILSKFGDKEESDNTPPWIEKKVDTLSIVQYFENNISDIPLNKRDEVKKYVSTLNDESFDITKFTIEEFGDNVLKCIYVWSPKTDAKLRDYNYLIQKIQNLELSRDLVTTSLRTRDQNQKSEGDWFSGISLGLD